ncbi:hypothetical protein ACMA5I_01250 [Paracoccaceae bacterium GXU_MW_L88]
MALFLLILLTLALIAIALPRLRLAAAGLAILMAGGLGTYLLTDGGPDDSTLSVEDLRITDMALGERPGGRMLSMRVHNDGAVPLESVTMRLQMLDCPTTTESDACEIIGEGRGSAYVTVPPGQLREMNIPFALPGDTPAQGNLLWRAEPDRIRAGQR